MTAHDDYTAAPAGGLSNRIKQAAIGAMLGSAAGDALGAPFEFRPAGLYSSTFPSPVIGGTGEMIGGGSFGWAPAEFTDDSQMAVALAEALIARDLQFDPDAVWEHFRAWVASARDVGNITRAALSHAGYHNAAEDAHTRLGRSAGNGSVMRIAPIAIAGTLWDEATTVTVARAQSALTHHDLAAGWGAAVVAALVRRLILGQDFDAALTAALEVIDEVEQSARYRELLAPTWTPGADLGNGSVWGCVASAVWAVRQSDHFDEAVVAAIDLGDDTDTVAAVAGAIAGARSGVVRIPSRWTTPLHGTVGVPSRGMVTYRVPELTSLVFGLLGDSVHPDTPPDPAAGPQLVSEEGVHAANLLGAARAPEDMAIVSLCRGAGLFDDRTVRREIHLIDKGADHNPDLHHAVEEAVSAVDAFVAEGRPVVVHCHGGHSRTGLVLKAWYMRRHGGTHDDAHRWLTDRWPLYRTWNDRFADFLDQEWMR